MLETQAFFKYQMGSLCIVNPDGMRMEISGIYKDLVLIGGGHSHGIFMKMLGMSGRPGYRIRLISDVSYAPYSGMLPGLVAGLYDFEQVHIDLRRLCTYANVDFIHDEVIGLDPVAQTIFLKDHPPVSYDVLSINIGSRPNLGAVSGAAKWAIPVKPVPEFLKSWEIIKGKSGTKELVIAGGGAAGVELSLCMKRVLGDSAEITLINKDREVLLSHNKKVRKIFSNLLQEAGIRTLLNTEITEVREGDLLTRCGQEIPFDDLFWATNPCGPSWLAKSGLSLTKSGFINVKSTLQVKDYPNIFAAGDIATIEGSPRPKSGVFAVRAAKPLFQNVFKFLDGNPLIVYEPQKEFLNLIGDGRGGAVASRGRWGLYARWLWPIKDWIDKKFMDKFSSLEPMGKPKQGYGVEKKFSSIRCKGCGSKIGQQVLERVLARLSTRPGTGYLVENAGNPEDAALVPLQGETELIQTVDYFPA